MAGDFGCGDDPNQLHFPFGLDIDDDGSLLIADKCNHRIVRWKPNGRGGEIIAGGKGSGSRANQLNGPVAVLIDQVSRSLIVSEEGNRRIMRWPLDQRRANRGKGEVIISNVVCLGLAMDNEGSHYISDIEKDEICRYEPGEESEGVIVAGGNGKGAALNQLNGPRQIFVDSDRSVYVSDADNHRVMKWANGAKEGVVVAGGQGQGNSFGQLHRPTGVFVDRLGSVYVADQGNHRVMRWMAGAKEGELLVGGNGQGSQNNQLNRPASISLDDRGNLYVVDRDNHQIQCFQNGASQDTTDLLDWWNRPLN